jgi:uncharacterized SAM-binding protein YcdF (DUF218 family)
MNIYNRWFPRICRIIGTGLVLLGLILSFVFGASFNNFFAILLGFSGLLMGWVYHRGHGFRLAIHVLLVAVVLFFALMAKLMMGVGGKDTASFHEEYAIVLGCGIKGETVSPTLRARLDQAVVYARRNPEAILVVSGGQGGGERISEALAMERYLVAHGIPTARIIREEQSTSTIENLKFSKELLNSKGAFDGTEVTLITSNFHMYRALKAAQGQGIRANSYGVGVAWYLLPGAFLRETASICKFWLLSR